MRANPSLVSGWWRIGAAVGGLPMAEDESKKHFRAQQTDKKLIGERQQWQRINGD
jgi:hypothetical protein